jgi:monofunctional biosynthetic peptidoglycan transglycosylase
MKRLAQAWRKVVRSLLWVGAGSIALSLLLVLVFRWAPLPTSAFMLGASVNAWREGNSSYQTRYEWVSLERISPHAARAVIAAEDQLFFEHQGFDFAAIRQAMRANAAGKRIRGASTISQQTAKNLFLWPSRSWVRKGLEVWFTLLIELCWPKERILEVYLNIAQFGSGVYGVEAAAQKFFRKDAAQLTRRESAILAAVLPSPVRMRAATPSAYVRRRANFIQDQMRRLPAP